MTLLNDLKAVLSEIDRSIVVGFQLEHHFTLDDTQERIILIILTDRVMTMRGGNGHDGIDGVAVACLRQAARALLERTGSVDRISDIVIRQRNHNLALEDI